MKQFEYIEVPMSQSVELIKQLNEWGANGWEFVTQAQKINPVIKDMRTGQPVASVVLILKRQKLDHAESSTKEVRGN